MSGARGLLINITGGEDLTLFEVDEAANRIRQEVDDNANIIFGSAIDESLNGRIRVSVVATGIDNALSRHAERPTLMAVGGGSVMPMANAVAQHQAGQQAQGNAASPATPHSNAMPAPRSLAPAVSREPAARAPSVRPMMVPVNQPSAAQPAPRVLPVASPRPMEMRQPETRIADVRLTEISPAAGFDLDEPPLPPRQIPQHLQQPLRPQAPAPRPAPRAAEPKPQPARPALFAEQTAAPTPRKSLFGIVTGAIRGHMSEPPAEPTAARAEPQYTSPTHDPEPPRTQSRPSGGEEIGIEIPAFLRRQS